MASKRKRSSRPPKAPSKINGTTSPTVLNEATKPPTMPRLKGIIQQTQVHSGPLPAPDQLGDYERVSPGAADRIITMAEKQQGSRIDYQTIEQKRRYDERRLGQIFAFVICMVVFYIVYQLAMNGKEVAASVLGVGGLASIVAAFLKAHSEKTESKPKNK